MKIIRVIQTLLTVLANIVIAPTWASTTFTDNTFNLSDYSTRIEQTGGATIDISHTLTGGNPEAALQILTNVPSGPATFRGNEYLLNKSFIYDPATQGVIQSIGYSEDVFINFTGISIGSKGGDLLIYQNGNYYVNFSSLPAVNNVWGTVNTENLGASSFNLISNLTTGATDSLQHPNFTNEILQFGIVSSVFDNGSHPAFTSDVRLDNLSINISSVPIPAAFWLMSSALVAFRILGEKRNIGG